MMLALAAWLLQATPEDCRIDDATLRAALKGPPGRLQTRAFGSCFTLESRFDRRGAPRYWAIRDRLRNLRLFVIPRDSDEDREKALVALRCTDCALPSLKGEYPGIFTIVSYHLDAAGNSVPFVRPTVCY
ncbi:MAG: hypothetical protein ACOZQL_36790 [Myxococcota bacterium]